MSHISVLLSETIDAVLGNRQHGTFIDATFGRGGHSRALLQRLDASSRVIAFDKDVEAYEIGRNLMNEDSRFEIIHASFAALQGRLNECGIQSVEGVMADLGVSSPQLDQPSRGFSFMQDGPLDMRMDTSTGLTARQWLAQIDEVSLADALFQYGEERYSRRIAKAIKAAGDISTTLQLAEIVKAAHPKWERHKHPATRTFQAIRIVINRELDDVISFLPQALQCLTAGGRLAVISFHSLEDRIVKQFIHQHSTLPEQQWPIRINDTRQLKKIARIRASEQEVADNPRARSAWLRVAERLPFAVEQ